MISSVINTWDVGNIEISLLIYFKVLFEYVFFLYFSHKNIFGIISRQTKKIYKSKNSKSFQFVL